MATIKSYTDLSQSKVLSEILPLESADMYWFRDDIETPKIYPKDMMKDSASVTVPCWSLSALINVLPNGIVINKDAGNGKYHVSSTHIGTYIKEDNPVDACVAMIEKLHELKIL